MAAKLMGSKLDNSIRLASPVECHRMSGYVKEPPFGGYNFDIDFLRYGASSFASLFIDTPSPMSAPAVRFIV